jgi:hypothetical protein
MIFYLNKINNNKKKNTKKKKKKYKKKSIKKKKKKIQLKTIISIQFKKRGRN